MIHGTYSKDSQTRFKNSMLKLKLCDYSHAYILVKITITVPDKGTAVHPNNSNKKSIFENCAPFTNCISEISSKQIDDAKDIHVVMLMYNLIEHSDNHSRTAESLWQYYRDKLAVNDDGSIVDFPGSSDLFKCKRKTG